MNPIKTIFVPGKHNNALMLKGFEYIEEQHLLVSHITRYLIFDEVSYLLTLTMLITKIKEHNPQYILIIVKNKKIFNFDLKFSHWLEMNLLPAMKAAGVKKIAFVLPFALKSYRLPEYSEPLTFDFAFFTTTDEAGEWFGLGKFNHLNGYESQSVEIPI